mmetsp:Transcript_18119/g.27324  ORF Transcript_18119/g.27324 Transcript_18119/m.27324 type:complete len:214 (+) Transcript_18119:350-991(+)
MTMTITMATQAVMDSVITTASMHAAHPSKHKPSSPTRGAKGERGNNGKMVEGVFTHTHKMHFASASKSSCSIHLIEVFLVSSHDSRAFQLHRGSQQLVFGCPEFGNQCYLPRNFEGCQLLFLTSRHDDLVHSLDDSVVVAEHVKLTRHIKLLAKLENLWLLGADERHWVITTHPCIAHRQLHVGAHGQRLFDLGEGNILSVRTLPEVLLPVND